jgi:hypothetical protein
MSPYFIVINITCNFNYTKNLISLDNFYNKVKNVVFIKITKLLSQPFKIQCPSIRNIVHGFINEQFQGGWGKHREGERERERELKGH